MSIKDDARAVMAAKLVADTVKGYGDTAKQSVHAAMVDAGIERVRVTDDDGTDLGAVTLAAGRRAAKVTDEGAFTEWVAQRYPTEVVPTVRDATRRKLLDEATKAGDPVDTNTGEVIPGVEVLAGEPYVMCRPTEVAREQMAAALAGSDLLALGGGS